MTGETAVQGEPIAEEGEEEAEYIISDDDEEAEQANRYQTDRIILPSPRVSVEEREMPIMVRNTTSFEERIMTANPEAAAPVELQPCDTCGRKFNPTALERHAKICEKAKSKPS